MTPTKRACTNCGNPDCWTMDYHLMCGNYSKWEPRDDTVDPSRPLNGSPEDTSKGETA